VARTRGWAVRRVDGLSATYQSLPTRSPELGVTALAQVVSETPALTILTLASPRATRIPPEYGDCAEYALQVAADGRTWKVGEIVRSLPVYWSSGSHGPYSSFQLLTRLTVWGGVPRLTQLLVQTSPLQLE